MFPVPRLVDPLDRRANDACCVMGWIVFDGAMTAGEIARRVRMPLAKVTQLLIWLRCRGMVRKDGSRLCTASKRMGRKSVWRINGTADWEAERSNEGATSWH